MKQTRQGYQAKPLGTWRKLWQAAAEERRSNRDGQSPPVTVPRTEVEPVPAEFVARPGVHERIVAALGAAGGDRNPVSARTPVALVGMGGAGKSTLARAVAGDPRIKQRFRDGVLWFSADDRSADACRAALSTTMGTPTAGTDPEAGIAALRAGLRSLNSLIVLDNVTVSAQVRAMDVFGSACAMLITTRDLQVVSHGQVRIRVDPLDPRAARAVLAAYARVPPQDLSPEAGEVAEHCGGLPLALAICGALAGEGYGWDRLLRALARPRPAALVKQLPDYEHPSVPAAIAASTGTLAEVTRACYEDLAVFADCGPVPVEVAELMWRHRGLDDIDTATTVELLARRCLLTLRPETETFVLHELLQDYTRDKVRGHWATLHERLATAFLDGWGGLDAGLPGLVEVAGLDDRDRYGLTHVAGHLVEAGRDDLLDRLFAAESRHDERVNTWFVAHERAGLVHEYLDDLAMARERAAAGTDQASSATQRDVRMALEIRYDLIRSSIVTRAAAIPASVLSALLRNRVWTFPQAEAYAALMPDAQERSAAYQFLARAASRAPRRRRNLVELAAQAAESCDIVVHRIVLLVQLLDVAGPEQRESIFERALASADGDPSRSAEFRAWVLANAARWFPQHALRELRAGARHGVDRRYFLEVLPDALSALPQLYGEVLEWARKPGSSPHDRSKALRAALAAAGADRDALIHERLTGDRSAPELRGGRHLIVEDLAEHLSDPQLRELVHRELPEAGPYAAASILTCAIPRLADPDRSELIARATDLLRDRSLRPWDKRLVALLRTVPEPGRRELLEERVEALFESDPAAAARQVAACAAFAPDHLLRRAAARTMHDDEATHTLRLLAPHFTRDELCRYLALRRPEPSVAWAGALANLTPAQPSDEQPGLVRRIVTLTDDDTRVDLLARIVPRLARMALREVASAVTAEGNPAGAARLFVSLAARTDGPGHDDLLGRAREAARLSDRKGIVRLLLTHATTAQQLALALRIPAVVHETVREPLPTGEAEMPPDVIASALRIARRVSNPCHRACELAAVACHVPADDVPALLHEAMASALVPHGHDDDEGCENLDVLWRSADRVAERARPQDTFDAFAPTLVTDDPDERLRQLSCLIPYLPAAHREAAVAHTLDCLEQMTAGERYHDRSEWRIRSGFAVLAPHLDPAARRRALRIAHNLPEGGKIDVYAELAATADPVLRAELLSLLTRQLHEGASTWDLSHALTRILPWLGEQESAALIGELFEKVRHDGRWHGAFSETVEELARHLTPGLLDKVAGIVARHPSPSERARASTELALASSVTLPEHWPRFWRAALADAAALGRSHVLVLLSRLPLDERPDLAVPALSALVDVRRWWPGGAPDGETSDQRRTTS
ncbi:NB-ARC domain-containing protein [Embleya scabrispora]|uniref:NB-ARC domain-containing protein n=1 Tax=Embleya scabrispora TaxID=159449 RepID=UPI001319B92D|nr:NB-ARC domain-containing protein [Embleya scabrispora]MYS84033.1 hypothetical protein [Streptomyces sp. SID5474]